MIREITLGQYYQADSYVHRLDPRVKLFATIGFIITLFCISNILGYIIATLALYGTIRLSKVPLAYIVRGMKAIVFILLITVFFNIFLTQGEHKIVSFWIFTVTWEGIKLAFFMGWRLMILIIASSLMTLTTTPNQLTDGLEKALHLLNKVKFPVHEMAMMMSIALRFIPVLLEETDKIMKAQTARGADFESGNLVTKAKAMIPLLVPLFISAFRRANDLAMAMESRGYRGGVGRTKMKPLIYKKEDKISYLAVILFMVVVIIIGRLPFYI